jgi:hypothetical protein
MDGSESQKAESPASESWAPRNLDSEGHSLADLEVLKWGPWVWNEELECEERMALKPDGVYLKPSFCSCLKPSHAEPACSGTVKYDYRQDIQQNTLQYSQQGAQKYHIVTVRSREPPSSLNTRE